MSQLTASPRPQWGWIKQFTCDGADGSSLIYVDNGDLLVTLGEVCDIKPAGTAAAVCVLLGVDDDHHEVHVDTYAVRQVDKLTEAITALEVIRDRLSAIENLP